MAIQINQVDMDLEVMPGPAARDDRSTTADDVWRILRSSAFRELVRPLVVQIISDEIERTRRRIG
jgi:hypothetical protein